MEPRITLKIIIFHVVIYFMYITFNIMFMKLKIKFCILNSQIRSNGQKSISFILFTSYICKQEIMLKHEILDSRDRGSRNFIPERGINASNRNGFAYRLHKQIPVVRISLLRYYPLPFSFFARI